ncbi:uncharacterized protein [Amphiura filiformis]|uniref:uncharacterized protein n=1 Tax=Amphiura filiformis TaxID=82378 RepID=UPI003B22015E
MATTKSTRVKAPTKASPSSESVSPADIHEVVTLKPKGGVNTDRGGVSELSKVSKLKLLKCKKSLYISTLNTRTMSSMHLQEEICGLAKLYNQDIIGIQEHRIVHQDEEIRHQDLYDGYQLVSSSAWRNTGGVSIGGGVGLLLSPKAKRAFLFCNSVSPRILCMTLAGNPRTTVIVTYCPTNVSEERDAEQHFQLLDRTIRQVPAHSFLIVMGDFNGRVGMEYYNFPYHETTNRNGEMLHNLALENDLVITNVCFRKKEPRLWTCRLPSGFKVQIDYILVRRKWRNSVTNSCAYNSFASIGSDHRIVTAKIRLSLRASGKTPPRKVKYDWRQLVHDDELQERYTIKVQNQFSALRKNCDDNVTAVYECFIQANKDIAEELIPKARKRPKEAIWHDPRIEEARRELQQAQLVDSQEVSNMSRSELQSKKNHLRKVYEEANEQILKRKIRSRRWRIVTSTASIRQPGTSSMKLVGVEYDTAKKDISEGKSTGEDGIPPEVLKRCNLDDIVLNFCNEALMNGKKPDQWSILNLIPIPKSGDLREGKNYRGICLSSIVAKTFNRLLLNRIRTYLDPVLRFNQNGFRPGRSTVSQILALRRIIEEVKNNNLNAAVIFIDFKKAFDTIHRGKVLDIMRAYGVPERLVAAIGCMYHHTIAHVTSPDGVTKDFEIQAGVLQGDTLPPFLFIVVLDYVLRKAMEGNEERLGFTLEPRKSRRIGPRTIIDLDFADDIALLADNLKDAQELLHLVEAVAQKVGLEMNAKKTKAMLYKETPSSIKTLDGSELEID